MENDFVEYSIVPCTQEKINVIVDKWAADK